MKTSTNIIIGGIMLIAPMFFSYMFLDEIDFNVAAYIGAAMVGIGIGIRAIGI